MVDALDEPIGDPAAMNTVLICHAAREAGVKVLLSGMGADELFGGYRKHYACLLAARYRGAPRLRDRADGAVDRLPVAVGGRGLRSVRLAKRFVTFAYLAEEPAFRRSYTQYDAGRAGRTCCSPDLAPHVGTLVDEHAGIYNTTGFDDPVNRMCMADSRLFLAGLNLAYTDRSSMAASTEVRVPFVDIEVARAAFRARARRRSTAAQEGRLKRAAAGMAAEGDRQPAEGSVRCAAAGLGPRDLARAGRRPAAGGELVNDGFLRQRRLEQLIRERRSGAEDRSKQIWQLLTPRGVDAPARPRRPRGRVIGCVVDVDPHIDP